MRKVLLSLVAIAAAVFATSCTNDLLDEGVKGGNRVTFNISTPELATRAFGDGATATDLYYAVYEGNTLLEEISVLPEGNNPVKLQGGKTSIMLDLASGIEYNLIFWAAAPDAIGTLYNVDFATKSMSLINPDTFVSQNENLDAFYAYVPNVVAGKDEDVELYRPFAQLNISVSDADILAAKNANLNVGKTQVSVEGAYTKLNLTDGTVSEPADYNFALAAAPKVANTPKAGYTLYSMNYLLVDNTKTLVDVKFGYTRAEDSTDAIVNEREFGNVPVQRNYRTNIYGDLLTKSTGFEVEIKEAFAKDDKYGVEDGKTYIRVANAEEFNAAIVDPNIDMVILENDIVLTSALTRAAADATLTISKGKEFVIDLGGKTLSATSTETGKNYNMIDVRGTLTVKNGTITTEHAGTNMAWNNSTNVFNVTDGGVLNLNGVTAQNLGGSDMAFVAHLNNWGEVTLNVENSYLESTYVAVRVFNSGNDMNNVDIKNSTLKGGNYAFWVHNYTLDDFGTQEKVDAQKALLNLNIFNQGNTFVPDLNGIRYGFTNSVKSDAYGITKSVSEDGSVVTLGAVVEDAIIRRYVAGTEENNTIKEVVIGEGVAVLYDRTFRRYYALESVTLPSTLTTIGATGTGVFQTCSVLKNINLPAGLTTLGVGSFYGCRALEEINVPEGVTRIEENVFRETGLKSIEFHEGVTYFGKQAFRDCEDLEEIIINAPSFTIESNTFLNAAAPYPNFTIHVANKEMKEYLEGMFDAHTKTFITVSAPNEVETLAEFKEVLKNAGAAGAGDSYISLAGDIDMTGEEWTPIAVDGYHGADIVTLDGNGATIKGLTSALFAGGFAGGSGIVIKNLTIEDSAIVATNTQGYGAFVCNADSMDKITLINCHLKNSSIITPNDGAAESRIGGLVGWTAGYDVENDGPVDSYITIKNCSVIGCTLKGAGSIGAICGHAGANPATYTTIENCTATNNKLISTDDGGWRVGVVVGTANNGQCVIKNITESGNTLEQTGKTAPVGDEKRNYYGRFVPAGTGTLTIDGVEIM